ncbi:MAG: hypothetical protein FWH33_00310 [Oscillospiraceae bacterium]|nr:hypothetical protein [Oscillospiraceae bacterium]
MTFQQWYDLYPKVEPQYESMKKKAVHLIWESRAEPSGYIKEPMIRFTKPPELNCFSWHQVYHAMAMSDVDMAVQTLMNMFQNQDEFGELPDLMTENYINITATKPPIHGYGALRIIERYGDLLTTAHCEAMYPGLSRLYGFWTTLRDTDNDGVPQYNHGCESGFDFSTMFAKGVPVETPDIICYVALLAEALAEIANRLGLPEAQEWARKSNLLLDKLFSEFWNGSRFIAMLSGLHEHVLFDSIEAYFPFMLGKRLPAHISAVMADDLETCYLSPYGLRSEPKSGRKSMIMGFSQVIILPGLYQAGYRDLATKAVRGFTDYGAAAEPVFFFADDGSSARENDFTKMSALSAAMWLDCATFLYNDAR